MDQQKLRSLVFEKTGVKIDVDDPVFALVALNEAVLEEAVERHVARIDAASENLLHVAQQQGHGHGHAAAEHPPGYVPTPSAGMVRPIATQSSSITPRELRLLAMAAGIAILSALLVLGGQAAFHKSGLSAEQAQALQKAERIERALQQLDPKLRAQLPAELQK
ncbi:hypothetical protein SAMN05216319_3237 [Duganella sp. CF402]|uniref:hypothetical protein n=1 Tax=unclassified Duganella TaxID=2636909 RepID=UPI0008C559F9|nr:MULTISPECIES: hypothetical protein [unclassified Duganella]RZT08350.1 hypothetical protein EV582_0382 [Duganella sp. BK701]SEL97110.1 hypothetical protein SAMN05216319_3237 [Duganella sp. CF402]